MSFFNHFFHRGLAICNSLYNILKTLLELNSKTVKWFGWNDRSVIFVSRVFFPMKKKGKAFLRDYATSAWFSFPCTRPPCIQSRDALGFSLLCWFLCNGNVVTNSIQLVVASGSVFSSEQKSRLKLSNVASFFLYLSCAGVANHHNFLIFKIKRGHIVLSIITMNFK